MPQPLSRIGLSSTPTSLGTAPLLQVGARGAGVVELQRLLQAARVPTGPVDGVFGPMTQAAVRRFQTQQGLPVDGVVGPQTWSALRQAGASQPTAHTELRQGDFGAEVELLQQALGRQGFDPRGVDGQFGPNTRNAVVQFQRAKGLLANGVVSPATWQALEGPVAPRPIAPPASTDFRSRILDIARGEIGTLESGTNRGAVLKYPNAFGRGAEAYCADFTSWVLRQAGGRLNNPSCQSIINQLKTQGLWKGRSNPQPGDLVLFDHNGNGVADHIGIVESVNGNGTLTTIEGNTRNPLTLREGVWRRTRTMSNVMGFGTPF